VCAVRAEMACGPGARQPPCLGHPERSIPRLSAPRIGIPRYDVGLPRCTHAYHEGTWQRCTRRGQRSLARPRSATAGAAAGATFNASPVAGVSEARASRPTRLARRFRPFRHRGAATRAVPALCTLSEEHSSPPHRIARGAGKHTHGSTAREPRRGLGSFEPNRASRMRAAAWRCALLSLRDHQGSFAPNRARIP